MFIVFKLGIADLADPLLFIDRLNDRPQVFCLLPMLAAKGHVSIGFLPTLVRSPVVVSSPSATFNNEFAHLL
jgi:hypothetical protein